MTLTSQHCHRGVLWVLTVLGFVVLLFCFRLHIEWGLAWIHRICTAQAVTIILNLWNTLLLKCFSLNISLGPQNLKVGRAGGLSLPLHEGLLGSVRPFIQHTGDTTGQASYPPASLYQPSGKLPNLYCILGFRIWVNVFLLGSKVFEGAFRSVTSYVDLFHCGHQEMLWFCKLPPNAPFPTQNRKLIFSNDRSADGVQHKHENLGISTTLLPCWSCIQTSPRRGMLVSLTLPSHIRSMRRGFHLSNWMKVFLSQMTIDIWGVLKVFFFN